MSVAVATDNNHIAEIKEFLKLFLKESSRQMFMRYSRATDVSIVDLNDVPPEKPLAEEMGLIALWGKPGTIILKTHFNPSSLSTYIAQSFSSVKSPDLQLYRNYIKEFCNMQAGYIRGVLEENNVLVGMSLPFSAVGADEIKFREIRDPDFDIINWKLVDAQQNTINCSAEVKLFDLSVIDRIKANLKAEIDKNNSVKQEDSGDVEFL